MEEAFYDKVVVPCGWVGEIGVSLPNNQRQHSTLHIEKDVLPHALCQLPCPVSAALVSFFRMDSISTSYRVTSLIRNRPPFQDHHRALGIGLL